MTTDEKWEKRLYRERAARKEAEKLLEEKSLELWTINQELELKVDLRTEELKKTLSVLEESIKAKDMFLAKMSHELRTPLNAIIGFSQILMLKDGVDNGTKKYIEKINISGNNLLNLVNTILDFSKFESNEVAFTPSEFFLKDLLKEVYILIEPIANKKDINLEFIKCDNILVYADKDLIKRVFVNLLTNAVKFTNKYGNVSLEVLKKVDYVEFRVKDDGIGIKKDDLKGIFMPFTQVRESFKDFSQGSGLGLAIVQDIINLHNGSISVTSEYEVGTEFFFKLPLNRCEVKF